MFHENGKTFTKNYFKKVDSNSFLDYGSCHHRKWLQNIPYGQFCHIRCNCSKDVDFKQQSSILQKRFQEKKYLAKIIQNAFQKANCLTQENSLAPKISKKDITNNKFGSSFITTFKFQHKKNQSHPEKSLAHS